MLATGESSGCVSATRVIAALVGTVVDSKRVTLVKTRLRRVKMPKHKRTYIYAGKKNGNLEYRPLSNRNSYSKVKVLRIVSSDATRMTVYDAT